MKWILRYFSGTMDTALCFEKSLIGLHGYVDADMAGDLVKRNSATRGVCTLVQLR